MTQRLKLRSSRSLRTRWTDDERTTLFDYYLGPESDEVFEKLKLNASSQKFHLFLRYITVLILFQASKVLFEGKYTIKAQYISYDLPEGEEMGMRTRMTTKLS
jgi:hypothetical protein